MQIWLIFVLWEIYSIKWKKLHETIQTTISLNSHNNLTYIPSHAFLCPKLTISWFRPLKIAYFSEKHILTKFRLIRKNKQDREVAKFQLKNYVMTFFSPRSRYVLITPLEKFPRVPPSFAFRAIWIFPRQSLPRGTVWSFKFWEE